MKRIHLFGVLGGFALVVAGGLLWSATGCARGSGQPGAADRPVFTTLAALTHESQLVAHVRVVEAGVPYTLPPDPAVVVTAPPAQGRSGTGATPPPEAAHGAGGPPELGVPKVDVTVEVVEVIRGDGAGRGDRLVVVQTAAGAEADPAMQPGTEEILFLRSDPATGKHFTTGGGQGRFRVMDSATVQAVDGESALAAAYNGMSVDAFRAAVRAVSQ